MTYGPSWNDESHPQSCSTDTELSAIIAPTGALVYHSGNAAIYEYKVNSVLTPATPRIIASVAGGNWERLAPGTIQTVFAEVSANATIAQGAGFLALLTGAITTIGGNLEIQASFCAENSAVGGIGLFEIWLDGANIGPGANNGSSIFSPAGGNRAGGALIKRKTGLAAGAHTVELRWAAAVGGNNLSITPGANDEHASLLVREVTP